MNRRMKLRLFLTSLFIFSLALAGTVVANTPDNNCPIPESGPWPPCATGGEAADEWQDAPEATQPDSAECVIPESGAWPPCATGQPSAQTPVTAPPPPANNAANPPANAGIPGGTELIKAINQLRFILEQMGGLLDRIIGADTTRSCQEYVGYYMAISELPVYNNLPQPWQPIQDLYIDAAINALETNKDIFLQCKDGGGKPSELNYGIARAGINSSLSDIYGLLATANEMAAGQQPSVEQSLAAPSAPTQQAAAPQYTNRQPPTQSQLNAAASRLYALEVTGTLGAARVPLIYDDVDANGNFDTFTTTYLPLEVPFAALDFWASVSVVEHSINEMGGLLDRLAGGSAERCSDYEEHYYTVAISPAFTAVPSAWRGLVDHYEMAILHLLDSNKDLLISSCFTNDTPSAFNTSRARAGIHEAREMIAPVLMETSNRYTGGQ